MKNKTERMYTIGEIFRQKLLLNYRGESADKPTISRIVRGMRHARVSTVYGQGYAVPLSAIEEHNTKIRALLHL